MPDNSITVVVRTIRAKTADVAAELAAVAAQKRIVFGPGHPTRHIESTCALLNDQQLQDIKDAWGDHATE